MDAERLAVLRAGPGGSEWQDVRAFAALMSDGSTLSFVCKKPPELPKEWARDGDGTILPMIWSTRVPLYCVLRLDHVVALLEVEVVSKAKEDGDCV